MAEMIEFEAKSTLPNDELLDEQRHATIEQALAGRTINLCTKRTGQMFANPLAAFLRYKDHNSEDHSSNID